MAILCDMHSLMPVGFLMFLSMNEFLPGCLFAVVVIKKNYDWSECVMSVLGTTKHSLCNQCIDTWQ